MSPTPDRRKTIDFSNAYYTANLTVVVRKNSKYANATSVKDFKGAKITAQLNTYHYDMIKQLTGAIKEPAMNNFPAMRVRSIPGPSMAMFQKYQKGLRQNQQILT